jgi:cytochrome c2
MNFKYFTLSIALSTGLVACGVESKNEQNQTTNAKTEETTPKEPKLSELALKGEQLFQANCMQCHLISKDALIGPGMSGVAKRVPSKEWAKKFINNSQAVIKSGDKYAVALNEKYNKSVMTSFNFSDEEFESLWQYLEEAGQ